MGGILLSRASSLCLRIRLLGEHGEGDSRCFKLYRIGTSGVYFECAAELHFFKVKDRKLLAEKGKMPCNFWKG